MQKSLWLLLCLAMTGPVLASPHLPSEPQADPIPVQVNGQILPLDVSPRIIDHRVLVPLRGVFEFMGATVDYHASTRVITVHGRHHVLSLGIEAPLAFIDRHAVHLSVAPVVFDGRAMVPLRFVSEALGAHVEWLPDSRLVRITTPTVVVLQPHLTPVAATPPPVEDANLLSHVAMSPPVLTPGGSMAVEADGRPASHVDMAVGERPPSPMTEHFTGVYQASSPMQADDVLADRRVVVHVESPNGTSTTQRTLRPLPMQGAWIPGLPVVARIETNGTEPLYPGQRLVVGLDGTPGLHASFSLGDVVVPMPERHPGQYRGEYVVLPGDLEPDVKIQVLLTGPTGQISVEAASPAHLVSP